MPSHESLRLSVMITSSGSDSGAMIWGFVQVTDIRALSATKFRRCWVRKDLLWLVVLPFISGRMDGGGSSSLHIVLESLNHAQHNEFKPDYAISSSWCSWLRGAHFILLCRSIRWFKMYPKLNKLDVTPCPTRKPCVYNPCGQKWCNMPSL